MLAALPESPPPDFNAVVAAFERDKGGDRLPLQIVRTPDDRGLRHLRMRHNRLEELLRYVGLEQAVAVRRSRLCREWQLPETA